MRSQRLLPLLAILSFCFIPSAAWSSEMISMKIVDQDGRAVEGARVTLSRVADSKFVVSQPFFTWTDQEGRTTFTDLISGTYRISVNLRGYVPVELRVPIEYAIVPRYRVDNLMVVLNQLRQNR